MSQKSNFILTFMLILIFKQFTILYQHDWLNHYAKNTLIYKITVEYEQDKQMNCISSLYKQYKIMGNRQMESLILRSQSMMSKIMMGQQSSIIEHVQGEKINIQNPINQMGDTIGHYAAYRGHYKVLQYLVNRNHQFDIINNRGLTAIDVATPEIRQWIYKNKK